MITSIPAKTSHTYKNTSTALCSSSSAAHVRELLHLSSTFSFHRYRPPPPVTPPTPMALLLLLLFSLTSIRVSNTLSTAAPPHATDDTAKTARYPAAAADEPSPSPSPSSSPPSLATAAAAAQCHPLDSFILTRVNKGGRRLSRGVRTRTHTHTHTRGLLHVRASGIHWR